MVELLNSVFWDLIYGALVKFGAVLVRAASGGRWKAEPLLSQAHRLRSPAGALSYMADGVRVVTSTGQALAAVLVWALLGVGLCVVLAQACESP